jgi:succinyl-diaminopimelate desuccinylase
MAESVNDFTSLEAQLRQRAAESARARQNDVLALTADLVAAPSENPPGNESLPAEVVRAWLPRLGLPSALVVAAQTNRPNLLITIDSGKPGRRLGICGHLDTKPVGDAVGEWRTDPFVATPVGDRIYGLGSTDMKGGLAVMLELARTVAEPAVDLTYVFYAREEVAADRSGLLELQQARPDLLVGDVALLGEPTSSGIEAGCQGTMRIRITLMGERAHPARAWMGRNAVHRAAPLLAALEAYEPRRPEIQGCRYHEALLVVRIEGGVAGNVVPDRVELLLNHRFAPDRTPEEAVAHVHEVVDPWIDLDGGDTFEVVDAAAGAAPAVDHPLIAALIERHDLDVVAKLGWTDVARFAAMGVPAANFGPGDATIAHTAGEWVGRADIEASFAALDDLVRRGAAAVPSS